MEQRYNRKGFVDDFSVLTNFEYDLLPFDVQMAYVDSLFGSYVKEARENEEKEHKTSHFGFIEPRYAPYFDANGCAFESLDYGKIECFDPTKVLEISEEAKEKLEYYFNVVGNAKADAFESAIKRYYQSIIDTMDKCDTVEFVSPNAIAMAKHVIHHNDINSLSDYNDEEKRIIMEAELSLLLDGVIKGEVNADNMPILPDAYLDVLKSMIDAENLSREDSKQLSLI